MKLDLGCGKNKQPGHFGVDSIQFEGVDVVHDLTVTPWPWEDGSIEAVHCSHFFEHLTQPQRVVFLNELYRILKPGGTAQIITPHWSHERAYGDPTHAWPPVTCWAFYYANKAWRDVNAPHTDSANIPNGFTCDFGMPVVGVQWDVNDAWIQFRVPEVKSELLKRSINTCTDMITNLTKPG